MCFFAGGVNRMEQAFNMTVAQTASSLLFLAVSSLLIPTAFNEWANTGQADKTATSALVPGEAALSRATAILLLIVYASYLFFQLKSHVSMYSTASEKNKTRDFSKQKDKMKNMVPSKIRRRSVEVSSTNSKQNEHEEDDEDEPEQPQLSLWVAIATLAASTVLVALNAEYLVDSIDAITCGGGISKNFVGLILLPIVGNAAEHATAVTVAIKDKMDLAIGVAVGSSMQIALLVLPLMVVLGWIIGKDDMTLYFDGFQIAMLFVSILLVNYLIQDGKSHWLEGVLLMILYVIIAVAAWYVSLDIISHRQKLTLNQVLSYCSRSQRLPSELIAFLIGGCLSRIRFFIFSFCDCFVSQVHIRYQTSHSNSGARTTDIYQRRTQWIRSFRKLQWMRRSIFQRDDAVEINRFRKSTFQQNTRNKTKIQIRSDSLLHFFKFLCNGVFVCYGIVILCKYYQYFDFE